MAVIQISRIQVRRGQKNQGSGLPQLASGELGWAVDTRELFIGNGSVSEGAPQVGNTKVLTEYDDIFTLADTYAYRSNDPYIITGTDSANPTLRTLQDRLDDRVSGRAFGLTGTEDQDATPLLQRALDQLYLNDATKGSEGSRVVLHLEPGIYTLTGIVYVPPHATIVGAGPEKTVIKQTATDAPVFQTINDSSTPGSPASDSSTTFLNQARNIRISNLTLENTAQGKGLILQSCRDSSFENINIVGTWQQGDSGYVEKRPALELASIPAATLSSGNTFINCKFANFDYGVISNYDVVNNQWNNCRFEQLGYGVVFGETMSLGSAGQLVGPSKNFIQHSLFQDIDRHAVWVRNGKNNSSNFNKYISVGNDAGTEGQPVYSVIKYEITSNESIQDYFSRTAALSYNQEFITGVPYIPEVEGPSYVEWGYEHELSMTSGSDITLFRLPQAVDQSFDIDYVLSSESYEFARSGTMIIVVDSRGGNIELSDEFHFAGEETDLDKIQFYATIDLLNETIYIKYTSTMPNDDSSIFKFKVKNKQTNIA